MVAGHVFVVRGSIGTLVADAAIVSTDAAFKVESHWHAVVTAEGLFRTAEHRPQRWSERGWGRDAAGGQAWFLDVTAAGTGDLDAIGRLRLLLADISKADIQRQVRGRTLPLVVLPVIGTKGGGFGHQRGRVVEGLLRLCQEFVAENPVDLAIVASNSASFAALQNRRREATTTYFDGLTSRLPTRSAGRRRMDR